MEKIGFAVDQKPPFGKTGLQDDHCTGHAGEQAILEIYTLNGLVVEIGHGTMASLKKEIAEVTKDCKVVPPTISSIGGFLDALPLHGRDSYCAIKSKMPPYPKALAKKVIEKNLGFFWKGCLKNQGLNRGEILFVYDGMSVMLKRAINILAALNGLYFWAGEPRWIEYWSKRMKLCPPDLWPRIKRMYRCSPAVALNDMERLLAEVLELVANHMPEVNMSRATQFDGLRIQATERRPKMHTIKRK